MKRPRLITFVALTLLLAASAANAAEFFVSPHAGDYFGDGYNALGVSPDGVVHLVGERDGFATLFSYTNGTLNATTLTGMDYALVISRDGRNIGGLDFHQGVLSTTANPGMITLLGFPPGRHDTDTHGVSNGTNPVVAGFSGIGSFVWTTASGSQAFLPPPGEGDIRLTDLSADGAVYVGSTQGLGDSDNAFSYHDGAFTYLDEMGGFHAWALCVSPNGQWIGGYIDAQATIWGATNQRLTLNGGSLVGQAEAVTDHGFAVGGNNLGGWVYDPRTGTTKLFDAWWVAASNSVPQHVAFVTDALEANGMVYFALQLADGSAALAITDVVFPSPPPTLAITSLNPSELQLRWPTNQLCVVEWTPQLPPVNWTPLTNAVPVLNSNQFTLTLPITNSAAFFRLRINSP